MSFVEEITDKSFFFIGRNVHFEGNISELKNRQVNKILKKAIASLLISNHV